jgi:hypothetical protein
MIPAAALIMAPTALKIGLPRISGVRQQTSFSSTMKSMGMKEFPILTGISSAIPIGRRIDRFVSYKFMEVGTKESLFS